VGRGGTTTRRRVVAAVGPRESIECPVRENRLRRQPLIDLHTHVLPGIDDGAATLDDAVELARTAAGQGVRVLAATPHVHPRFPDVRPAELAGRVQELNAAIDAAGVLLEVVAAGEVDLMWAQDADDDALRLASYGQRGTDVLVETPYGELPAGFEDLLFRVRARGYRVLLAHPERSHSFQRSPARLDALVEGGTLLQVTAAAVVEQRGSAGSRLARALVREGRAHVLASDAHGPHIDRPSLRDGVEAAARLAPLRAEWMATDAPAAILAGQPLPAAPADAARRRRGWRRRG
jgi:protein-tyrosine phosphatase